jgi:hypothetical protein
MNAALNVLTSIAQINTTSVGRASFFRPEGLDVGTAGSEKCA